MYLLDTNICIAIIDRHPQALNKFTRQSYLCYIPTVVQAELHKGAYCSQKVEQNLEILNLFLVANILPIVLIIFGLFALLVTLAIFLPESEETQSNIEKKKDKEINSQRSTAKVSKTESYVPKERSLTYYSNFSEIRPELRRLELFPSQSIIQSGETIQFKLTGLDKFNNKTLLTLGVSTRILSWAIANEEFFYDVLAPLLNLTNEDDSLSQADALVQSWILEIGRRRVAKLLKKASNLSFKEAFSNISNSIDYIVVPKLRKIEFVNLPSNVKPGDRIKLEVIGLDQAGDVINIKDRIIWSVSSSKISSKGIFTAGEKAEDVEVIAKVKNKNIIASTNIKIELAKKIKYEVPVSIKTNKPFNFRIDKQDNDLLYELLNNWFRNLSDYSYSKIFENLSFEISSYLVFNVILKLPSFVTWFDELQLLYNKPFCNNYNCFVDEEIDNLLYETFDDYFVKLSDDLSNDVLEDYLYIISKISRELSFFFMFISR